MTEPMASDELYSPKDANQGAIYGPVSGVNTANEDQDDYPTETFGIVPNIPTTNVQGFFPYRGGEQHGVRFTHDIKSPIPDNSHYQAEQHSFNTYVDPKITPRDIEPVKPIQVQIKDTPDLIYQRIGRAGYYSLAIDGVFHQILAPDKMRRRVVIAVRTTGTTYVGLLSAEDQPTVMTAMEFSGGVYQTLLDSTVTSGIWVQMTGGDGTAHVSYWTEYMRYDGTGLGL